LVHKMIPSGRFFFKWRNLLFPLIVIGIYAAIRPSVEVFSIQGIIALAIIALGVLIRLSVIGFFNVVRDGDKKTAHADQLFTRGMFGISRNTLYLGNLTTYFGIFLLHGAPLALVIGLAVFVFIYYSIIFSEESFLQRKFGASFESYVSEVPRLLPNLANWSKATSGMAFSWKRAVFSEYNVIGQSILMVMLVIWYKSYLASGAMALPLSSMVLLGGGAVFMLTIRTIKRR